VPYPKVEQCIAELLQLCHAPKVAPVTQDRQQPLDTLILLGTLQRLHQCQQQQQ
jgi:hypothetical protein